jgi:hypothetical protein
MFLFSVFVSAGLIVDGWWLVVFINLPFVLCSISMFIKIKAGDTRLLEEGLDID